MRLQAIGEARVALSVPAEEANEVTPARRARFLPWIVAALCAGVAIVALLPRAEKLEAPVRLNVELGAGLSLDWSQGAAAVLSPDGSTLAFVAGEGGEQSSKLFVRRLDQQQATPLAGTESAEGPFFSPDGDWIGFFVGDSMRKIQVTGGASMTLADVRRPRSAWWGDNGLIALAPEVVGGLMKVSASGGELEPLTELDETEHEITHRWPQILPGGEVVLFTAAATGGDYSNASIIVALSLKTGERQIVHRGGFHARYLPSGHIVYMHDTTLYAARFDPEQLAITGERLPVVEGVVSSTTGGAQFAVSETGTLVYSHGAAAGGVTIQWMQRDGSFEPLRDTAAIYRALQFSPDGSRLALSVLDQLTDIWVYELQRGTMSRLTFHEARDYRPIWTSDGKRIVFGSTRNEKSGSGDIYWKAADGTGDARPLLESEHGILPNAWHPGGDLLAYTVFNPEGEDIFIVPVQDDESEGLRAGEPEPFLTGPFNEVEARFSPDGHFISYASNESGRFEVYVRPFPGSGGRWQISTAGGYSPEWSPNGRELFYRGTGSTRQMMVVGYSVDGDTFIPETPAPWSDGRFVRRGATRTFSLHPDGDRFAVFKAQEDITDSDHVTFVFNFFDELERLAPAR